MEKIEEFWAGIWEDNTKTLERKGIKTVAKKIGQKVTNVQELKITEKNMECNIKMFQSMVRTT